MASLQNDRNTIMRTFWGWFQDWNAGERRSFLERLLPLMTPNKLFALFENLGRPSHESFGPSEAITFEQKVSIVMSRLRLESAEFGNAFLNGLEEIDYSLMCTFYDSIAATAGEP